MRKSGSRPSLYLLDHRDLDAQQSTLPGFAFQEAHGGVSPGRKLRESSKGEKSLARPSDRHLAC